MQTREAIHEKIDKMLADVAKKVHDRVTYLLGSGAFNLNEEADDYRVPKQCLVAALRYVADEYTPLPRDRRCQRELRNLEHF